MQYIELYFVCYTTCFEFINLLIRRFSTDILWIMLIYLSNNQCEYGILDEWNDGKDEVSFPIFHSAESRTSIPAFH